MVRLKIDVGFPDGPEGRVKATIFSYLSDVKAWIPENSVDDIDFADTWSDVEDILDTLNPDGILA